MDGKLTLLQKLAARLGYPNDNGGSNYSDPEMRYFLRNYLNKYDEFIPTPVLRDAWKGARIRAAQPFYGGTNYPEPEQFDETLHEAIQTRLLGRNAPQGFKSPSGGDYYEMWNSTLSPEDAILRQVKLDQYQGSGTGDYFPPRD